MLWLAYILIFLFGLVHTPLVVDALRQIFPQWNIQRLTNRASSIILILLIIMALFFGLGVQVFVFIPLMPQVPLRPLKLALHCLFAYWLWINAAVNYMYALLTRPGKFGLHGGDSSAGFVVGETTKTTPERELSVKHLSPLIHTSESSNGDHKVQKPRNSHFCKICQSYIPYKDHHCPFTGNCIGLNNYSYFFLWLFYSMIGLGYGISVFLMYFGECFFLAWKVIGAIEGDKVEGVCRDLEPFGEVLLPSMGGCVTITLMFLIQVFMLLADVSTYELLKNWRGIRIDWRNFRKRDSRFRVMLHNQRTHAIWFLLPVRNKHCSIVI